jgi:hypothetical protein
MTIHELNTIEARLRRVDRVLPGGYGVRIALDLAAELRQLIVKSQIEAERVNAAQSQSDGEAVLA